MYSQTFRASICWQFGREFFKATLETLNYKWEQINQCRANAGRIHCCCSLNCALRDGERKIDQSLLPGWNVAAAKRVLWFPRKSFIRLLEKIKVEHRHPFNVPVCHLLGISLTRDNREKSGKEQLISLKYSLVSPLAQLRHILICNTSR